MLRVGVGALRSRVEEQGRLLSWELKAPTVGLEAPHPQR